MADYTWPAPIPIPTRREIRAVEFQDLDYRIHALNQALVYHRDVSTWKRLGRPTTDEEDRAFGEMDVLDTAKIFEDYLRGKAE